MNAKAENKHMGSTTPNKPDADSDHTSEPHKEPVATYQQAVDEALDQSFPASDPIPPSVAEKADAPTSTAKDEKDWTLNSDTTKTPKKSPRKPAAKKAAPVAADAVAAAPVAATKPAAAKRVTKKPAAKKS
ncbi:MAG: hypothetical protein ABW210_17475, partial [Achromobacter sp.]